MPEARMSWGHININVSDLDRAIGFYEKLGFSRFISGIPYLNLSSEEQQELPGSAAQALGLPEQVRGRACIMQLDDGFPKIDLTELSDQHQKKPLANQDLGVVRLCLVTEDLQAEYERLSTVGVEFLSAPQPGHDGLGQVATCVDPDGTLIEILQVHLERWAPYLS